MNNSHTKFGWILSNGLGGDSVTDGRRRLQFPHRFLKKRGDNKFISIIRTLKVINEVSINCLLHV